MLGFSTGCLYKSNFDLFQIIKTIKSIEEDAIELSFGSIEEFISLSEDDLIKVKNEVDNFSNISIHAPFRDIQYDDDTTDVIVRLHSFANSVNANYVVFHPDTITNGKVIEMVMGRKAAIENMDKNKLRGQTGKDLDDLFKEIPSARFVMDLNHIYTIDKSMALAGEFYTKYKSKFASYHISGYGGEDALHIGLSNSNEILRAVPDKAIIAIHEGAFESAEQMLAEYLLVKPYFL